MKGLYYRSCLNGKMFKKFTRVAYFDFQSYVINPRLFIDFINLPFKDFVRKKKWLIIAQNDYT